MPAPYRLFSSRFSRFLHVLGLGAASVVPAHAQMTQPWPDMLVNVPLGHGWLASGEVIERIADDARPSQLETRAQIGHALGRTVTLWGGWVHFATYNPHTANGREDQAVEQLNWTIGAIGPIRLATRTRLEERFIRGDDDLNWRWRQQLRAAVPLRRRNAPSLIVWTEPYIALNRTVSQSHTLDQLRTFAGVLMPISRHVDLEVGYLNQRLYRPASTIVNDAIPIVLTVRF